MDRAINALQRLTNMDTLETDALYERLLTENPGNLIYLEEMLELARKLERERDEARELAQQMSESNQVLMADTRFYRNAWQQLKEIAK